VFLCGPRWYLHHAIIEELWEALCLWRDYMWRIETQVSQ
jgi:hypothetical protein